MHSSCRRNRYLNIAIRYLHTAIRYPHIFIFQSCLHITLLDQIIIQRSGHFKDHQEPCKMQPCKRQHPHMVTFSRYAAAVIFSDDFSYAIVVLSNTLALNCIKQALKALPSKTFKAYSAITKVKISAHCDQIWKRNFQAVAVGFGNGIHGWRFQFTIDVFALKLVNRFTSELNRFDWPAASGSRR